MAERLGDAVLELRTDDRKYLTGIRKAKGDATRLDQDFQKSAKSATALGAGMNKLGGVAGILGGRFLALTSGAAAVTAAIGAVTLALSEGVRNAREFGKAMNEVATLLPDRSQLDGLADAAKDFAVQFGTSNVDQAKALYQIISAGATDSASALAVLEAANRLAIGGVTDMETAADGLTTVLNAYGAEVGNATDVSDAMFVAMRAGKTTIGELSRSLGVVAPLAATAGVRFDELLAAVAALTKQGISTKEAMTSLRAIISAIIKPTEEAKWEAEFLGLQFNAAALKTRGLAGMLDDLRAKTGGSINSLGRLVGQVEALNGVLALVGAAGKDFDNVMDSMKTKAGETATAVKQFESDLDHALKRAGSAWENLTTRAGSALAPALTAVANEFADTFGKVTLPKLKAEIDKLEADLASRREWIPDIFEPILNDAPERRLKALKDLYAVMEGDARKLAHWQQQVARSAAEAAIEEKKTKDARDRETEWLERQRQAEKDFDKLFKEWSEARDQGSAFRERAHADFLAATGQEIKLIEERRDKRLEELEKANIDEADKARLSVEIHATAEAQITAVHEREMEKRRQAAEKAAAEADRLTKKREAEAKRQATADERQARQAADFAEQVTTAWLQATDQQVASIEHRRERQLAALEAMGLDEEVAARLRVQINQAADADIARAREAEIQASGVRIREDLATFLQESVRPMDELNRKMAELNALAAEFPEKLSPDVVADLASRWRIELDPAVQDTVAGINAARDAAKSLADDFLRGKLTVDSLGDAITNMVSRLISRDIDKFFDQLVDAAGRVGGAGGGIKIDGPGNLGQGSGGGFFDNLFGSLGSLFASFGGGGRIGGRPPAVKLADPGIFAGARHMRFGGEIGLPSLPDLGPNEIPIVGHRGEVVLPAPRNDGSGGAGKVASVNIRDLHLHQPQDPYGRSSGALARELNRRLSSRKARGR